MNSNNSKMKTKIQKFIVVITLILLSAIMISCSKKNVEPDKPHGTTNEKLNGKAIMSAHDIVSGEQYFKITNHDLYFTPPDDISEPFCLVLPTSINGMKVEYVNGIYVPEDIDIVEIYVPDGIKTCTISDFPKLERLVFADTVVEIHLMNIGEESEGLLEITWPDNEDLFIMALQNVCNVEELYLPEKVMEYELGGFSPLGFWGWENLKKVVFPKNLKTLGDSCVWVMDSLEQVELPSSVTSIDLWSFSSCEKLSEITLHEGLVEIGDYCFSNLPSNDFIDVPDSVESIGEGSFMDLIYGENDEVTYDNTAVTLGVGQGTYAEQYAKENGINYIYH